MSLRADCLAGAKAVSPLVPPAATVGLVTGVAATSVGLSQLQAVAMSVVVYSPTVMLTAFALLESETPLVVLVVASLVVGVRFTMLSLSIAPYFERLATGWKWLLAYFLWTPVYALSVERYEADPATSRRGYYLGTALPLWAVFQAALVVGLLFGTNVPTDWQLGFVVPLAFIALLMRMVSDRPTSVAALVAGVIAVFASVLPLNVGIVAAAVGGTGAGVLYASRVVG
jgi:predicted branched-subunit amino acid permease